ncbi:MAG: lytic transglycosylase domain-containing protein [Clostridiales bacterium]|nr:lytic transglycosylase domain-containing protein [Clostridiales bacterium]
MFKKTILRSVVVILILSLSIGLGFLIEKGLTLLDEKNYPQEYSAYVSEYSELYGVPEYIVYAVIKTESNFDSSLLSSSGAIGLMQLLPETFEMLNDLTGEEHETGMLYDPETNIKYGTYYLSYLYGLYERWGTVYAAYIVGTDMVDSWLSDGNYSTDGVNVTYIPYDETRETVEKLEAAAEMYEKLYY